MASAIIELEAHKYSSFRGTLLFYALAKLYGFDGLAKQSRRGDQLLAKMIICDDFSVQSLLPIPGILELPTIRIDKLDICYAYDDGYNNYYVKIGTIIKSVANPLASVLSHAWECQVNVIGPYSVTTFQSGMVVGISKKNQFGSRAYRVYGKPQSEGSR